MELQLNVSLPDEINGYQYLLIVFSLKRLVHHQNIIYSSNLIKEIAIKRHLICRQRKLCD